MMIGFYLPLFLGYIVLTFVLPESAPHVTLPPSVVWSFFGLACPLLIHSLWALWSVVRAWDDPAAGALRLASVGILAFEFAVVLLLLRIPFTLPH
jgi:hypothetical protein